MESAFDSIGWRVLADMETDFGFVWCRRWAEERLDFAPDGPECRIVFQKSGIYLRESFEDIGLSH